MKKKATSKVPLMFMVRNEKGEYRPKNSLLIKRFPRLHKGVEEFHLTQQERYILRSEQGEVPRGYSSLDKKWKKVARLVASGESVKVVCKKFHICEDTFYRRRRVHKLFRAYLQKCFEKSINNIPNIQNQQVTRAVNIVGESMESSDPYFRFDVAHKHLKGMGKYSSSQQIKQELSGNVRIEGAIEKAGIDKDIVLAFVQGMVEMSRGKPVNQIDITPEPTIKLLNVHSEVQDDKQREAS